MAENLGRGGGVSGGSGSGVKAAVLCVRTIVMKAMEDLLNGSL